MNEAKLNELTKQQYISTPLVLRMAGIDHIQEKVNRLLSLESERKNAEVCDYVVDFTTCEDAVSRIMDTLKLD